VCVENTLTGAQLTAAQAALDKGGKVIFTQLCLFCMENH
jgi:hypothetical protein